MIPPVYPVGANARARLIEAGWLMRTASPAWAAIKIRASRAARRAPQPANRRVCALQSDRLRYRRLTMRGLASVLLAHAARRKALDSRPQPLADAALGRRRAELARETEVVPLRPRLDDLATAPLIDGDACRRRPLARRREALELATMCAFSVPAQGDLVAVRHDVVDDHLQIRETRAVHRDSSLERLRSRSDCIAAGSAGS